MTLHPGIITAILLLSFHFSSGQGENTLHQKAEKLIAGLKKQDAYPLGGRDTLIDLNGDRYKDVLIEFYALSGTGEKNGIAVYLYDKTRKAFQSCEQLNYLANPTFYRDEKIVTGYYVANGGGRATKLRWKGSSLDTLEHIEIEIDQKNGELLFQISSYDYLTKKKVQKTLTAMELPKEYRYMDYQPIIKSRTAKS